MLDRQDLAVVSTDDLHALYLAHSSELRLTLYRLAGNLVDPNDLLQDVFMVALDNRAELARAASARAWLFGVAAKVAATRRRGARLRQFFGLDHAKSVLAPESPLRTLEQKEASQRIASALNRLSSGKREVFVLFELQRMKGEEIAQALGIPLKTVWTRLYHARREVSAQLLRLAAMERAHHA
jgi:RNA polymerase sigma-70 factor (ECF subfamily)